MNHQVRSAWVRASANSWRDSSCCRERPFTIADRGAEELSSDQPECRPTRIQHQEPVEPVSMNRLVGCVGCE